MDYGLVMTLVRYLAMVLAGVLVSRGVIEESVVEPIAGAAVALAALIWYIRTGYKKPDADEYPHENL